MVKPSKPKPKKTPQSDPPWKILWPADRGATKGDAARETLLAAVGFALSRWEGLEEELAYLFSVMVGARINEPAARAYGSVNNFHGRAGMVSAAGEAFFFHAIHRRKIAGPDHLIAKTEPNFNDLLKYCREFSARRNEIAHGKYIFDHRLGYFLKPATYNSKKYDFENWFGNYSYTSFEINHYADHFGGLMQWARRLRSDVETIATKIS